MGEVCARAEEMPDDGFFWVEAAVGDDVLTPKQRSQVINAIDRRHWWNNMREIMANVSAVVCPDRDGWRTA
jgi:hypothetical protein